MNEHWNEFEVVRGFRRIRPLFEAVQGGGFIAGSYAAYMATPSPVITPGDVDVFATSNINAEQIAERLMSQYGINWLDNNLVMNSHGTIGGMKIQIVRPNPEWKEFPADILNSFDMDVCRALLLRPDCVIADHNVGLPQGKLLRIHNPMRSLRRVMKYHRRGVGFDDWELIKLFRAWDEMPSERKQELINRAQPPAPEIEIIQPGPEQYWDEDDYFEGE